jgi:hypothetical protein
MTVADKLQMVCYLMMQERQKEARKLFGKIKEEAVGSEGEPRLQYDYIAAYFDFQECGQSEDLRFSVAKGIANKYRGYPVEQ